VRVLITGASGLLGRELVKEFLNAGIDVIAQYHNKQPFQSETCRWIRADFSDLNGIRAFLEKNRALLETCEYLVNNYGPITSKEIPGLTGEDFYFDFHHNLITAFEITTYLIRHAPLKSVVNVGFEFAGEIRPYKKILSYACAKNALLLLTESLEQYYPEIRFQMVFPPTMEGARVKSKNGVHASPSSIAKNILKKIRY
jgi:3-oxoacyl-[acyl-carrier protein] reductase